MSQYLIIFLIVAVIRGIAWVVQKVQQNAKAREALMAQQASAQMGSSPSAPAGVPGSAQRVVGGAPVASRGDAAPAPMRLRTSEPARATRSAQRGQARKSDRGSLKAGRAGATARAPGQSPRSSAVPKSPVPPTSGWATSGAVAADRSDAQGRAAQATPPASAPASRADLREARVGQSSRDVRRLLLDRSSLRQAILAREILGAPRGMIA